MERSDNLREGDVVIVVDDWGGGRDEDAQPDRLYHGGGLAVVHPAPVAAFVRDGQTRHHQLRQRAGHGGLLILNPHQYQQRKVIFTYRECVRRQSNDLDIRTE